MNMTNLLNTPSTCPIPKRKMYEEGGGKCAKRNFIIFTPEQI